MELSQCLDRDMRLCRRILFIVITFLLLLIIYVFIFLGSLQTIVVHVELGKVAANKSIPDIIQDDQEYESSFNQAIVYLFNCDINSSSK